MWISIHWIWTTLFVMVGADFGLPSINGQFKPNFCRHKKCKSNEKDNQKEF